MSEIVINTNKRTQFVDITLDVKKLVPSDIKEGHCVIFSTHTTAGIMINEHADTDVMDDFASLLDKIVPWNDVKYTHNEGNSAAHIKSSIVGTSQIVPVNSGQLCLGTWQGIFFCEFDGPRTRKVIVTFANGNTGN